MVVINIFNFLSFLMLYYNTKKYKKFSYIHGKEKG